MEKGYGLPEGLLNGEMAGTNHLLWFLRIWFNGSGRDAYPLLRKLFREKGPNDWVQKQCITLVEKYGLLPGNWSHVPDFFGNFPPSCWKDEQIGKHMRDLFLKNEEHFWIKEFDKVNRGEKSAQELLKQIADGNVRAPGTGHVKVCAMEAVSFADAPQYIMGVGAIQNRGAVREMASDDTLELPAVVYRHFAAPVAVDPIPTACLAMLQRWTSICRLTVDAAATGSREMAVQTLALDPNVHDITRIDTFLDKAISLHPEYYPSLK